MAWLDSSHPDHLRCKAALMRWSGEEQLAISSVTYAELAAGGRTREAVDEDLRIFERVDLDAEAAWRAGAAFGRAYSAKQQGKPVLPDFLIQGPRTSHIVVGPEQLVEPELGGVDSAFQKACMARFSALFFAPCRSPRITHDGFSPRSGV